MTDHIREFAEIVDCPEIQALRGKWRPLDDCLHPLMGGVGTIDPNYLYVEHQKTPDTIRVILGWTHFYFNYDSPDLLWLPPVSSISHPERSMVGAIPNNIAILPFRNGLGEWGINLKNGWGGSIIYYNHNCPTLEIAMATALRWWLTEGKK